MNEVAKAFVEIDELQKRVSEVITKITRVEAEIKSDHRSSII